MRSYDGWRALLADTPLPAAIVDLDALEANADALDAALGEGLTLRLASKSVRVPAILRHLLDRHPRFRGLMTYSAHETAWLADQGFDDLLLAYPIARTDEATALATAAARGATIRGAVDHVDQARHLSAAAQGAGTTLRVTLDLDASWRPGGGVHIGVRRSPLRDADAALQLARACRALPGLQVDSLLAYEAQVAGLPDDPGSLARRLAFRAIKAASVPLAAARRGATLEALRADGFDVPLVNGGGTGSIRSTSEDPSVTEVTAGSGFFCPHLFDGYDGLDLQPAAFFALCIVRRSDPDHVTAAGGGYVASGEAGPSRLPVVHAPPGLELVDMEGFGEVQTPFHVTSRAPSLSIGDPVVCRAAKAGEPLERFARVHLVREGTIVETVPTYRGAGQAFL